MQSDYREPLIQILSKKTIDVTCVSFVETLELTKMSAVETLQLLSIWFKRHD